MSLPSTDLASSITCRQKLNRKREEEGSEAIHVTNLRTEGVKLREVQVRQFALKVSQVWEVAGREVVLLHYRAEDPSKIR